jgi:hypothetical protein
MKNNTLFAVALLLASAASAQTPIVKDTTATTASATIATTTVVNAESLKGLTTETLRPEHSFPILGNYKAAGTSTGDVTIALDETNKGIVWVEGFPQGKFKALMKKAPSTYKIPAQQTESGKAVAEGTLFLNPESKELTIVLGRPFNDADPISFPSDAKGKVKAWQYTGIKTEVSAAATPAVPHQ